MNVTADGTPIAWEPFPIQGHALVCPARDVGYGGEKGAGKTEWLIVVWFALFRLAHQKWVATGQKQHKCRVAIFRENLKHLEDFIAKSKYLLPMFDPAMGIEGWNVNRGRWTLSSGATLEVNHLDGPDAHLAYQGQEMPGIGYDQAEQIEEHKVRFINANNRSGDPDYHAARAIRSTLNPGGHDWPIAHYHIDECPEGGRIFTDVITNDDGSKHEYTRCFIRARLRDNPHLPPDYEAQLRATMTEDEVAMYLQGDFFRVAGAFFSKFIRPSLHFQKSRPIPSSWNFRFAMDWGSSEPSALYVGAEDNDGCLWVIDELHMPGDTGRTFGERMAKMWQGQQWCADEYGNPVRLAIDHFYGVIDKQAMDRTGGEGTAAAGIQQWGFRLWPANKDRENGCVQMKERLMLTAQGRPRVIIFEDRCPKLVRALSAIKSNAPKDPETYQERTSHTHACDGFRFLCMEFPVQSPRMVNKQDAEVQRWEDMLRKQRMASADKPTMTAGYE